MAKTVLLIGNTVSTSTQKLITEAKSRNIIFDTATVSEMVMMDDTPTFINGINKTLPFTAYDVYYFRGIGRAVDTMQSIAAVLSNRFGKRVVELCFAKSGFPEDKFVPLSQKNLYKVPEYLTLTFKEIESKKDQLLFPLVAKKVGFKSSKGRWVRKVETFSELVSFMQTAPEEKFILQKFLDITFDTRILIVGDQVLGGFDRHRSEESDFLTTSHGVRNEAVTLTSKQIEAALEAATLQGLEIAGVDMCESDGDLYIFEVNASPQFKVFDDKNGGGTAGKILDYLLR